MTLERLRHLFLQFGVRRLLFKPLAPNDNSKNQPYFGSDFSVLNILPSGTPVADKSGSYNRPIFKAALDFWWMDDAGRMANAPGAQLILYPQYPEVRLSGYLRGCPTAPSDIMGSSRAHGRGLFLGIRDDGRIVGFAAGSDDPAVIAASVAPGMEFGVFLEVGLGQSRDSRQHLLDELCRISKLGWIAGKKLNADDTVSSCNSPNCGGYTLEAELGIKPNGRSEPDFFGWEVKQHSVKSTGSSTGGILTLMTPEPNGGLYKQKGVVEFVRKYGYLDKLNRMDRRNFGGVHRAGVSHPATGLVLTLSGYDAKSGKITDGTGGVDLVDLKGECAARWSFVQLMTHWNRKHANAAYVRSRSAQNGQLRQYAYDGHIHLGIGTDFLQFLAAMSRGMIYYDPGIKVENWSGAQNSKRRSQFRIRAADLPHLYHSFNKVDACSV